MAFLAGTCTLYLSIYLSIHYCLPAASCCQLPMQLFLCRAWELAKDQPGKTTEQIVADNEP